MKPTTAPKFRISTLYDQLPPKRTSGARKSSGWISWLCGTRESPKTAALKSLIWTNPTPFLRGPKSARDSKIGWPWCIRNGKGRFPGDGCSSREWLGLRSLGGGYLLWGLADIYQWRFSSNQSMGIKGLPVCMTWHSEWRKSSPFSITFKKAFSALGGNPILLRCLPKSQSGSRNGSKTKHIWFPNGPWIWNDFSTRRTYLRPSWLDRSAAWEMRWDISTSSWANLSPCLPLFVIFRVRYLLDCQNQLLEVNYHWSINQDGGQTKKCLSLAMLLNSRPSLVLRWYSTDTILSLRCERDNTFSGHNSAAGPPLG